MEELVQPDRLRDRILVWVPRNLADALPQKAGRILEAILYWEKLLARRRSGATIGASDRHSRRVVAALIERGVVVSESTRAPLCLTFPASWHHAGCRDISGTTLERLGEDTRVC